jgi:hypothetical protein
MKSKDKMTAYKAAVISACGFIFTILIGFLLKQKTIFTNTDPGFSFVVWGLMGAVLFSILKFWGFRNFIFAFFFLFVFYILRSPMRHAGPILAHLILSIFLAVSIFVYLRFFYPKLVKLAFGKFLILAVLLAFSMLLFILVIRVFIEVPAFRSTLGGLTFYGFLIGTGLGLGFEIGEFLNARIFKQTSK